MAQRNNHTLTPNKEENINTVDDRHDEQNPQSHGGETMERSPLSRPSHDIHQVLLLCSDDEREEDDTDIDFNRLRSPEESAGLLLESGIDNRPLRPIVEWIIPPAESDGSETMIEVGSVITEGSTAQLQYPSLPSFHVIPAENVDIVPNPVAPTADDVTIDTGQLAVGARSSPLFSRYTIAIFFVLVLTVLGMFIAVFFSDNSAPTGSLSTPSTMGSSSNNKITASPPPSTVDPSHDMDWNRTPLFNITNNIERDGSDKRYSASFANGNDLLIVGGRGTIKIYDLMYFPDARYQERHSPFEDNDVTTHPMNAEVRVNTTPDGSWLVASIMEDEMASGLVAVFHNANMNNDGLQGRWKQFGETLAGATKEDLFGISTFITNDGTTLVVGAMGGDYTVLFDSNGNGDWKRSHLIQMSKGTQFGFGVSLSFDKSRLIVAAPAAKAQRGTVFAIDVRQDGNFQEMVGERNELYFGSSMRVSSDGNRIVASFRNLDMGSEGFKVYVRGDKESLYHQIGDTFASYFSSSIMTTMSANGNNVAVLAVGENKHASQVLVFSVGTSNLTLIKSYLHAEDKENVDDVVSLGVHDINLSQDGRSVAFIVTRLDHSCSNTYLRVYNI